MTESLLFIAYSCDRYMSKAFQNTIIKYQCCDEKDIEPIIVVLYILFFIFIKNLSNVLVSPSSVKKVLIKMQFLSDTKKFS